jgi:hypothetical protein
VAAAAISAVVAAAVLAPASRPHRPGYQVPGAAAFAAEAQAREDAAVWVIDRVSRTDVVSCDPSMCLALRDRGWPAARLLTVRSAAVSPLRSALVMATAALRGVLGSRLETVLAPGVLASFGRGTLRVDILVVAPHGPAAYQAAARADLAERQSTGQVLMRSGRVTAPAAARRQLMGGRADSRLLIVLTGMAAHRPVRIEAFGGLAPGAAAVMPYLSADLSEAGRTAAGRSADLRFVLGYLKRLPGQFTGATASLARPAGALAPVLRIAVTAPPPLGLLGPQVP